MFHISSRCTFECNGFFIVRVVAGLAAIAAICCVSLQVWLVLLQVVAGLQISICRNWKRCKYVAL